MDVCHYHFMSIFQILKMNLGKTQMARNETDTVRKIVQSLDLLEPERAKFIACFAYLLGRAARADLHISSEETRTMERILTEIAGLPEDQAIIVVQMAKTQNILFGGTENYLVTREFKDVSTHQEKIALLDCLYAVAAAGDSISTVEDNEISQIADELRVEHRDFISVRSKHRDSLSVFRMDPKP